VRAGLWEKAVRLSPYGDIDFSEVQKLAEEQSVIGLIAAGLEHVEDHKPAKKEAFQFIGQALRLEQRNSSMNAFIGELVDKMRAVGIYTLLVKGQGLAQCYERPLWRSCGDIDFFLCDDNYEKAKDFLIPFAASVEHEELVSKHLGMTINPWVVELHGSLRCGLSRRMDKGIDDIKDDAFYGGNVRCWMNDGTQVFMLSPEDDAIYVFTHILNHFYRGGIGIRQICDWCRLLWTYRTELDLRALKQRIKQMGLMTSWRAFGAFAVEYLGMPVEAMPLYSSDNKWKNKAGRICSFIIEVGNFGCNRDFSYYQKYPFFIRKTISFGHRIGDIGRHALIFPWDSLCFFPNIVFNGLRSAIKG
jgi:hypothetical protein